MKLGLNDYRRAPAARASWPALVVVLLALLVWFGGWLTRPLEPWALAVGEAGSGSSWAFAQNWRALLQTRANLVADRTALQAELAARAAQVAAARDLARDNEQLRQALGWVSADRARVAAEVIPELWPNPFGFLRLQFDPAARVAVGDLALVDQAVALGRVVERRGGQATVRLFAAPGVKTFVRLGETAFPTELDGAGSGNFRVSLPSGLAVAPGDRAVLAIAGAPRLVGVVGAVERDPAESRQTVYLNLPFNFRYLRYVQIVAN